MPVSFFFFFCGMVAVYVWFSHHLLFLADEDNKIMILFFLVFKVLASNVLYPIMWVFHLFSICKNQTKPKTQNLRLCWQNRV